MTVVALFGCGRWGEYILRDLLTLGCDVHVLDPCADRRAVARSLGASGAVAERSELCAVAGVVVATPTSTHVQMVDDVLSLGVPVFVEKPLATELAGPRRLAATAADRVFVMHKWRYHPGVKVLADIARQGVVGHVIGLRLVRTQWSDRFTDMDAVWTLAPHDLSIVLEILGQIPPVVSAVGRRASDGRVSLSGVLGEDPWVHLEVGSGLPGKQRRVEVVGSEGVAVLSGEDDDYVLVYSGAEVAGPVVRSMPAHGELPLLAELRAFVGHLRGGPAPASSLADEVAVLGAIEVLRQRAGL